MLKITQLEVMVPKHASPQNYKLLVRYFCKRMYPLGLCYDTCEECKKNLKSIFDIKGTPRSMNALVIWRCRNQIAIAQEEADEKPPIVSNIGNPLEELIKEF